MPKPPTTVTGAVITGWGDAVPEKVVTNDDLAATMDTNDAWITERTGIRQRHVGGSTMSLSVESGQKAMAKAGISPDDLDQVVAWLEESFRAEAESHADREAHPEPQKVDARQEKQAQRTALPERIERRMQEEQPWETRNGQPCRCSILHV